MSEDNKRREFLKAAGAAVGGATMTLAAGDAAAQPMRRDMKRMAVMKGATRTATFRFNEEVRIEELMEALKVALRHGGCMACGLVGIDIILQRGGPLERIPAKIKTLNEATFG